jgi:hypothetical protein
MKKPVKNTRIQISIHLTIAQKTYPNKILPVLIGETNNSSIDLWNFPQKNELDEFP